MFEVLDGFEIIGHGWDVDDLVGEMHCDAYRSITVMRCKAEVDLALVVNSAERAQVYAADGHATVLGWCRVQNRTSNDDARELRRLGRLLHAVPALTVAAHEGRIGLAQLHALAKAYTNPRCGTTLGEYVEIFLEAASSMKFSEFELVIDRWELLNDPDGAHKDNDTIHAGRKAHLIQGDGTFGLHASGGALAGVQLKEILDRYCQAEWETDWAEVKALHGDAAHPGLVRRTDAQRRFDALCKIFLDAASTPAGSQPPEPVVNILIDHETFEQALIRLFGVNTAEHILGVDHRPRDVRRCDPRRRRCETTDGIILDPYEVVAAALIGQVRRVVFDSAGVVVDMGRKCRLFTGPAPNAVLLSTNRCLWPGCDIASGRCQTDHNREWNRHGPTDQHNGGPLCHRHNQWKNRGCTVWRDPNGNWHTYRPNGAEICFDAHATARARRRELVAAVTMSTMSETTPNRVRQMRLVVHAEDFEDAVRFYRDVLGLPEEAAFEGDGGAHVVILDAGRATLELVNSAQKTMIDEVEVGRQVAGKFRVAFEVDDSERGTATLVAGGADLVAPPTETPWRSLNARLDGPAALHLTLFQELDRTD